MQIKFVFLNVFWLFPIVLLPIGCWQRKVVKRNCLCLNKGVTIAIFMVEISWNGSLDPDLITEFFYQQFFSLFMLCIAWILLPLLSYRASLGMENATLHILRSFSIRKAGDQLVETWKVLWYQRGGRLTFCII
jgi:hypothetical protein